MTEVSFLVWVFLKIVPLKLLGKIFFFVSFIVCVSSITKSFIYIQYIYKTPSPFTDSVSPLGQTKDLN